MVFVFYCGNNMLLVRFLRPHQLNEGAGEIYMLEKTFMMMPPEIISTI
jgi:hypothetical protein